jgi:hypothetical protein
LGCSCVPAGDTLGIDISLTWLGPILFGLGAAAAIVCLLRSVRPDRPEALAWSPRNRRWLAILAACLPIQFALLRFGSEGSLADQIGVVLTIGQWLLVGLAFRQDFGTRA